MIAPSLLDTDHPPAMATPAGHRSTLTLDDGTVLTLRPIAPDDEPALALLHARLSERSVHFRYFHHLPLAQRIAHQRLAGICHPDHAQQIALVATRSGDGPGEELLAVGRLNRLPESTRAELALLVDDGWQGRGLGNGLLRTLLDEARRAGLRDLVAYFLPDNHAMRRLCIRYGFAIDHEPDDPMARARRAV